LRLLSPLSLRERGRAFKKARIMTYTSIHIVALHSEFLYLAKVQKVVLR
jgi:hypothetical protein